MSVTKGSRVTRARIKAPEEEQGKRREGWLRKKVEGQEPGNYYPSNSADDPHERLACEEVLTQLKGEQWVKRDESEKEEGHEELSDEEENQLDDAFKYLNELRREGRLIATQVEDLIDWAEDEIDNGESVEDVVQCLKRAKKWAQIFLTSVRRSQANSSDSNALSDEILQFILTFSQWSRRKRRRIDGSGSNPYVRSSGKFHWSWSWACILSLFRFGKYARDLKAEIMNVPFCSKRLDFGHLVNPRDYQDPSSDVFKLNMDGNNALDAAVSVGKALMF